MPENSVEQQIIDQIQAVLDGIQRQGEVRRVRYLTDLLSQIEQGPEIGHNLGPEKVITQDNFGYTMEAMATIRIGFTEFRGEKKQPLATKLKSTVQDALETDPQLARLANSLTYMGDDKFFMDRTRPEGGIYLYYLLQYRRKRGATSTLY